MEDSGADSLVPPLLLIAGRIGTVLPRAALALHCRYTQVSEGKAMSAEKVKSDVLPQVDSWLAEHKFLSGKKMMAADLVLASELIEQKKQTKDKNFCNDFAAVAKWLKGVEKLLK